MISREPGQASSARAAPGCSAARSQQAVGAGMPRARGPEPRCGRCSWSACRSFLIRCVRLNGAVPITPRRRPA